jgi:hypothetical protein
MTFTTRNRKFGCLPVSTAIILLSLLAGGVVAQGSFPSESDVLRRLDSIETRLASIEQALKPQFAPHPVTSYASHPDSFNLAPGERIVSVDGVPVGFPTLAVPITRTTTITPRRFQESVRFNAPSYYPQCNGRDCR